MIRSSKYQHQPSFTGMPVFLSECVTEAKEVEVNRSIKERLFSWPWRPWVSKKTEIWMLPSENFYMIGDRLIMHPVTYRKLLDSGEVFSDRT